MNKIKIVNDKFIVVEEDSKIEYSYIIKNDECSVNSLKIKVKEDTDLQLDISITKSNKFDIFINVLKGVNLKINEYINGSDLKIQYKYYLEEDSNTDIKKINNIELLKENDIFNLNGENAKVKRVLKTISSSKQKYDILVYHNAKETSSDLINHGVNIKLGELTFNVSSFVPKDMVNCVVNQSNRIVNLTEHNCTINPNMYIDCFDVTANHSAFIGSFSEEELFYLQSRGIDLETATKLLIRGFLTSDLSEDLKNKYNDIIGKYWR